jgi:hypothetical protein
MRKDKSKDKRYSILVVILVVFSVVYPVTFITIGAIWSPIVAKGGLVKMQHYYDALAQYGFSSKYDSDKKADYGAVVMARGDYDSIRYLVDAGLVKGSRRSDDIRLRYNVSSANGLERVADDVVAIFDILDISFDDLRSSIMNADLQAAKAKTFKTIEMRSSGDWLSIDIAVNSDSVYVVEIRVR